MSSELTLLDGQPPGVSGVAFGSEAFHFGLGVFTTIGVRGGSARWLEDHYARLVRDASALGLGAACASEEFSRRCQAVVEGNGLSEGGLKVIWYSENGTTKEWLAPRPHSYTEAVVSRGRNLDVRSCAPRGANPLRLVKSLNYAEHLLAGRAAKAAGFDDALWVDTDGAVLETTTANVYCLRGGEWLTPPLGAGILRGVTRDRLLRLGLVREMPLPLTWLWESEAVMLSNSLGVVMPVAKIGSHVFGPRGFEQVLEIRRRLLP